MGNKEIASKVEQKKGTGKKSGSGTKRKSIRLASKPKKVKSEEVLEIDDDEVDEEAVKIDKDQFESEKPSVLVKGFGEYSSFYFHNELKKIKEILVKQEEIQNKILEKLEAGESSIKKLEKKIDDGVGSMLKEQEKLWAKVDSLAVEIKTDDEENNDEVDGDQVDDAPDA